MDEVGLLVGVQLGHHAVPVAVDSVDGHVAADAWLDGLIQQSPAFQAKVEEELAAINVAQDLVALRESRGLSQAELASRLGITQSAIAQLESAQPKRPTVCRMSDRIPTTRSICSRSGTAATA
jgi:DNA-binding XRE family transcriptional regulator